jgi:hypothetical protein
MKSFSNKIYKMHLLVLEVCDEVCVEGDELPALLKMNVTYVNDKTYTEFFFNKVKIFGLTHIFQCSKSFSLNVP